MSTRNEAFGSFGLPSEAGGIGRPAALATAVALATLLVTASLVATWLASKLSHQPGLGAPSLYVLGHPVYAPWRALSWLPRLRTSPAGAALAETTSSWLRFSLALAASAGIIVFARQRRAASNRASQLHGSSDWATKPEIKRAGLFAPQGVIVGRWADKKAGVIRYLRHNGPEHINVLAPTRSGKGVGLVIPTLLSWQHSVFVLDPKGENFAKTAGYRQSLGHRVYKLDFGAEDTARFNPLSSVRLRSPHEVGDVQRIARMLVDPDGSQFQGPNKHWAETGSSLLTGAILHVLYRESARNRPASLSHVAEELADRRRSHTEVLRTWIEYPHDPTFTEGWLDEGQPCATHPVVATVAREQLNREGTDEQKSVLSSATAPLGLLRDPLLAQNTASSDFAIEDLMDAAEPAAVYFVLRPSDVERLRPLVRIFLDLTVRRLTETMSFEGNEVRTGHNHKLLLMLDEFPILGKLDIFATSLAYIGGWGIKAYLISQDYEQLRAAYGDRETITSNCHITIAYAANKHETAKRLSDMTGQYTAVKHTRSSSSIFASPASRRDSESEQEVGRPLLNPDECMRLPGPKKAGEKIVEAGDMLIFCAGTKPVYGKQALYFRDRALYQRSLMTPPDARPASAPDAVAHAAPASPAPPTPPQPKPAAQQQAPATSSSGSAGNTTEGQTPPPPSRQPEEHAEELNDELMAFGQAYGCDEDEAL